MKTISRLAGAGLAAIALAGLLTGTTAHAMKLEKQNLTQLITESQSIVSGTVKRVTDGFDGNGVPYTEVTLAVGSVAKGNITQDSEYTFRQFGLLQPRSMGNGKVYLGAAIEGFARWLEGETVVAFLYKPAAITGLQTTAGMAQGKFTQTNGMLSNEFGNLGLFDGVEIDPAKLSDEQVNMIINPGSAVDAAAFLDLVARAVTEGWIANGEMK